MTQREPAFVGIVGALQRELAWLRRSVQVRERQEVGGQPLWIGTCRERRVILVQSGVGRAGAERAAHLLLDRYPLTALLSIGFGGGVQPGMRVGDVVLCAQVYAGGETTGRQPVHSDEALLAQAAQALAARGVPFRQGSGLTLNRVLTDPVQMERIGRTWSVQVVDMESFWIGRLAAGRGIPLLVARAITDTAAQPLPAVAVLAAQGAKGRAVLHLWRNPAQAAALFRLARNARLAARNLGILVPALLGEYFPAGAQRANRDASRSLTPSRAGVSVASAGSTG